MIFAFLIVLLSAVVCGYALCWFRYRRIILLHTSTDAAPPRTIEVSVALSLPGTPPTWILYDRLWMHATGHRNEYRCQHADGEFIIQADKTAVWDVVQQGIEQYLKNK